MYLVAQQLDLFAHSPVVDNAAVTDWRFERTANQWHRSIVAYLHFRTGDAWRRLSDPEQRWDKERLDYLEAIRLMNDVRGFPEFLPAPLPPLEAHPKKLVQRSHRKKERIA